MAAAQRVLNWIGVVLTVACLAAVLAGDTELIGRFEHAALPLSWVLAGGAAIAFFATELCDPERPEAEADEDSSGQFSSEWQMAELRD